MKNAKIAGLCLFSAFQSFSRDGELTLSWLIRSTNGFQGWDAKIPSGSLIDGKLCKN